MRQDTESSPGRFLFDALNVYVFSRVAWDPAVDVDAILDEHYRLMYGAAAKDMQSMFEAFEDIWLGRVCGRIVHTSLGPKTITPKDSEIWTDIYSPAKIGGLLAVQNHRILIAAAILARSQKTAKDTDE